MLTIRAKAYSNSGSVV